jgi:imidazolonepropionase-like amidohydrolase
VTTTLIRRARLAPDAPPQGVLVAGGLVASVGPVEDTAGSAEIIDLDRRFVLPGL